MYKMFLAVSRTTAKMLATAACAELGIKKPIDTPN